jgi:hypothetical protein
MQKFRTLLTTYILFYALNTHTTAATNVIVGVNVVGVDVASDAHQDDLIQQFQQNGVTTVRTFLGGHGDRYTSFVIKAFQHGIRCVVVADPFAGSTKKHALPADAAAGRPWGLPALSDADPEGFRQYFVAELAKLEAAGVKITAFELGNELNTPTFNADFRPEQASHRILGVADLNNAKDVEGSTVAAGYLAYLKVMEVLKDLRDHSKLNQQTPILSGMSADWGMPQHWGPGSRLPDASVSRIQSKFFANTAWTILPMAMRCIPIRRAIPGFRLRRVPRVSRSAACCRRAGAAPNLVG